MAETIEQLIRRIAAEEGVNPDLAVAMARQESGLNPRAVGDNGDSVGLFQLNQRGMGAGMGDARYDPETNARTALRSLAQTLRQRPDLAQNPGALAAASQRPFDPQGYARSINAMLGGGQGTAHTGSAANPNTPATRGVGLAAPVPQGATPMAETSPPTSERLTTLQQQRAAAADQQRQKQEQLERLRGTMPGPPNPGEEYLTLDDVEADLAKLQTRLDTLDTAIASEQDKLAKASGTPSASSQYLNTDASDQFILARNPDGTIKMKPDGSGPETIPNPNYRPPASADPARQAVDLATAQTNLALAQQRLAEATSPEAQQRARLELEAARVQVQQAQATLGNLPSPEEAAASRQAALEASQASSAASRASTARTEALTPFDVAKAEREALAAQKAQDLAARLQAQVEAAMQQPDPAARNAALLEVAREAAAYTDPAKLQDWANQEAERELRKQAQEETQRANQAREQQAAAAQAEQQRQADAQAAQTLADVTTQRQQAFNQGVTQFEQSGVATKGRIAGLNALREPLPEEQVAAMLGGAPTDPRIQAIYRTYRQALGAPLPAPPAGTPPSGAPAVGAQPAPQPAAQPAGPVPAAYTPRAALPQVASVGAVAPAAYAPPAVAPPTLAPVTLGPVTLGPDGIPVASLRLNRLPMAYAV